MASDAQERRDAYAAEHGYDSYYEFRTARDNLRDEMSERDAEVTWQQANQMLDFQQDFDPYDNDLTRDELREWWDENIGGDEHDFYAWLHELYG